MTDRTMELQEAIDSAREEGFSSLEEAAHDELTRLWDDLHEQMRYARNGSWSLGCGNIAYRIAVLTTALGKAARWQDVQIELLETGVYQRFHDLMGMPYEKPDMEVIARMRAEREANLAALRERPHERCAICQRNAREWEAASAAERKSRKMLPPPDGCSMCAELNNLGGGFLGALRHAGKWPGR